MAYLNYFFFGGGGGKEDGKGGQGRSEQNRHLFARQKLQHRIATEFVLRLTCKGVRIQSRAIVQWRLLWSYSGVTRHVYSH